MYRRLSLVIVALAALSAPRLHASGADADTVPPVEPGPCLSAIAANDDDKVVADCGALIDNEKTAKTDRLKALVARAAAFARKGQIDRAISEYNDALRLDGTQADLYNSRGELYWKIGDRPKALSDFGTAVKLNPDHPRARANFRTISTDIERLGALMAVAGKPSFNCATAKRAVDKAICASPELANLDRQINAVNVKVVREAQSPADKQARQHEQDEFLARRNAEFGKPGYDLPKAMRDRLQRLLAAGG